MRPIKFRAWDKRGGLMCEVLEIDWRSKKAFLRRLDGKGEYFEDFEGIIFMQFTGLHDKNGKEIYEGDIMDGTWEVRWWNDEAEFVLCNPVSEQNINICAKEEFTKLSLAGSEIIGDIHTTPTLLEGKQ